MKSIIVSLSLFLFLCSTGYSQDAHAFSGKIYNENNDAISEGEIYIFNTKDNTIVKSELIVDGSFSFNFISVGDYTIRIISSGYKDFEYYLQLKKDENLKFILEKNLVNELEVVSVVSKRKTFTNTNGNLKIDISRSIFKSIPNPMDLLSKLPGLQINSDKQSISIVGKGSPLVYIDNQKATMNDLNALSVDDIKTIEIIKNPSAKYEAEGRAVLLITRKTSKKEGFEATISETASFKKKFNNYLGTNLSFKREKLELKANLNYNQLNPWESISNEFEIPANDISSNFSAESYSRRPQYIFGGGIYYNINEDDYLSLNINGKIQNDQNQNRAISFIDQNNNQDNIETLNDNDDNRNFFNSFANYNKKIKAIDAQLFTGVQYSNFSQESNSIIQNNYNNTQFDLTQNRNQDFTVDVFAARTDLEKSFKNEMKLEIGALFLSATANTDFEVVDFLSNNNLNTRYDFKEKNTAAYSQLSGKFKKVSYSVGVRAENTDITGKNSSDAFLAINKNYTTIFPKFQLDVAVDSTKTVSFNYAKSIARPNYSSTSQASIYTNPFLVFSRNINLDPTITDEISGSFQYKEVSVKLSLYESKDPVYFAFSFDNSTNVIAFNSINYAKESGMNLEFTVPYSHKIWSTTNILNFAMSKIEDDSAVYNEAEPYLYYYSNHIFELPWEYTFSITGWGFTKRKEGVFERNPLFIMDMAVSKTLFKSLSCTLSFNDVFRNMNFDEDFTINNITSRGKYFTDTREISLSISYKFGTIKNTNYKEKEVDQNSNRIN